MVAILVEDVFQRRYSANHAIAADLSNGKGVGFHQGFDQQLFVVSGFDIGHEHFKWAQRFDVFHLVRENVRFVLIVQIIVNHAPHRRVPGSGNQGNNLNGVLSVKHIVYPAPAADFDRIDLVQVKVSGGIFHVALGNVSLILLVGNQILNGDLLEVDVGNVRVMLLHVLPPGRGF